VSLIFDMQIEWINDAGQLSVATHLE